MSVAFRFAFVMYAVAALGIVLVLANYDISPGTILGVAGAFVVAGGAALIYWMWSQFPPS